MGNSKSTPKTRQKPDAPFPVCQPWKGCDSNGASKWFILLEGTGAGTKSNPVFLTFRSLVAFDTAADAELFCQMANAAFLSFPFHPKPTNHNAHKRKD